MSELTPIQKRIQDSTFQMVLHKGTIKDSVFQHSVLCQTFLPYRNPGADVRIWKQKQGNVSLAIQASESYNPEKDDFEFIGLPYGPKARLILSHINSEAIRNQSRSVNVEDSMSAFIRCMGLSLDGRTIQEVKTQLRKISTSTLSLGYSDQEKGIQVDLKIVKAFDLWFPKDERQRVLWPTSIQLTEDYFNSLVNHAIPLDERALAALSHSAMGLDIYAWLAQRLHRINPKEPQFLTWKALKEQFGRGYSQMYKFKQIFRKTLALARSQYPQAAVFEEKNRGYWLHNSPSPIERKAIISIGG
ncbi:MAG: replication protein RepA [Saprospiraceae bacterium]